MVSIIAARSETHCASCAMDSHATITNASSSNFFIIGPSTPRDWSQTRRAASVTKSRRSKSMRGAASASPRLLERAILCFRGDPGRYGSLAHFYYAVGIAFLWSGYHQILWPRRHLPKIANGFCRHSHTSVQLDPHLIGQTTKGYVERGSAFGFVSHRASSLFWYRFSLPQTAYNFSRRR